MSRKILDRFITAFKASLEKQDDDLREMGCSTEEERHDINVQRAAIQNVVKALDIAAHELDVFEVDLEVDILVSLDTWERKKVTFRCAPQGGRVVDLVRKDYDNRVVARASIKDGTSDYVFRMYSNSIKFADPDGLSHFLYRATSNPV